MPTPADPYREHQHEPWFSVFFNADGQPVVPESHTDEWEGYRGVPDAITKAGCIALARRGKEEWNAWRQMYPARWDIDTEWFVNRADFAGADFREWPIDFSGFQFGDRACFDGTRFGDLTLFDGAQFGDSVHFDGAQFVDAASFNGTQFGGSAHFDGTQFGDWAYFDGTQFGDAAHFDGAQFGDWAYFDGTRFGDSARFDGAQFGRSASFDGVQFSDGAHFDGAQFSDGARFDGAQFGRSASFDGVQFSDGARFIGQTWSQLSDIYKDAVEGKKSWAENHGLSPQAFNSISFSGAEFLGHVDFSGRQFMGSTKFDRLTRAATTRRLQRDANGRPVRDDDNDLVFEIIRTVPEGTPVAFGQTPVFHNCQLHQDTSFDGAQFPPARGSEAAARAYRTLKLAFAQQQALREEQFFFRKELEEEALRETGFKRWMYRAYAYTSDYGASVWKPLWTLVALPALFAALLYLFAMWGAHPELGGRALINDAKLTSAWLQFIFANMAPLPDSELLKALRDALFPADSYAAFWALKVETLQKILALIGYFLMGLALRNWFKMK